MITLFRVPSHDTIIFTRPPLLILHQVITCDACRVPLWERAMRLPYGVWDASDGRKVVFDRRYHPMLNLWPDDRPPTLANPYLWIEFDKATGERWFYRDRDVPLSKRPAVIRAALRELGAPTWFIEASLNPPLN